MATRSTLLAVSVSLLLGWLGPSPAWSADGKVAPDSPKYIVRNVGGCVYYYDPAGHPLFYDDSVHYAYPHRFHYFNGGWVLVTQPYSHGWQRAGTAPGGHRRHGPAVQPPARPGRAVTHTARR